MNKSLHMSPATIPALTRDSDRPLHVLLMDCDEGDLHTIERVLDSYAVQLQPLALERFLDEELDQAQTADVALLNLVFADDAADALLEIRAVAPDLPVVALVADDDGASAQAALDAGARDYLIKSQVTPELLARTVRHAVELNRVQLEQQRATRRAEMLQHELRQIVSVLSHELKTPLWVMQFFCDLLEQKHGHDLDSETLDFLRGAKNANRQMLHAIDAVRELVRLKTDRTAWETVDCNERLQHALRNLHDQVEASHALITSGALPNIQGNHEQIGLLFEHLLSNALKFTGGRVPEIHLQSSRQGDGWQIEFRDNGIGMEPAYHSQIFKLFQRLHGDDEYPGAGTGLALCQQIVENHHGRIEVESVPGHGSTFIVWLPAEQK